MLDAVSSLVADGVDLDEISTLLHEGCRELTDGVVDSVVVVNPSEPPVTVTVTSAFVVDSVV